MSTIPQLTDRQRQVIQLAAEGLTNDEIGAVLHLSVHTVSHTFERIYAKLGIRQARQQAILLFLQGGRYAAQ